MAMAVAIIRQALRNPGQQIWMADHVGGSNGRDIITTQIWRLVHQLPNLHWSITRDCVSVTGEPESFQYLQNWVPEIEGEPPEPLPSRAGVPIPPDEIPQQGTALTYNVDINVAVSFEEDTTPYDIAEEIRRRIEIAVSGAGGVEESMSVEISEPPRRELHIPSAWERLMSDE